MADEPIPDTFVKELQDFIRSTPKHESKRVLKAAILGNDIRPRTKLKPDGWGKLSNATYYKEKYALDLKPFLDDLIKTREPVIFRYDKHQISRRTLYLKINLSFMYLVDKMDIDEERDGQTTKRYGTLKHEVDVWCRNVGVVIEYKNPNGVETPLVGQKVEHSKKSQTWRNKVDHFIVNGEMESRYEDKKVALNDDEVEDLLATLHSVKVRPTDNKQILYFKVTSDRILIIKTEADMMTT